MVAQFEDCFACEGAIRTTNNLFPDAIFDLDPFADRTLLALVPTSNAPASGALFVRGEVFRWFTAHQLVTNAANERNAAVITFQAGDVLVIHLTVALQVGQFVRRVGTLCALKMWCSDIWR